MFTLVDVRCSLSFGGCSLSFVDVVWFVVVCCFFDAVVLWLVLFMVAGCWYGWWLSSLCVVGVCC